MVITITPVSPSACLPGDKGQFQEWLSSLCLLWLLQPLWTAASHLQTTFSNYSFSNTSIYVFKTKKKNLNKLEKPNLGRSTRFSLCSVNHSFREAYQPCQIRVTFPKQRNQMKATAKWRKGNYHLTVGKKHFQCSSTPVLCLTTLSTERGRERIGSEPIMWDSSQEHRQTMGWTKHWSQRMKKFLE